MADYNFLLNTRLGSHQLEVLRTLEQACQAARMNLYLTGGSMRDLLASRPVRWLDCTVEGVPATLEATLRRAGAEHVSERPEAHALSLVLRGCRVRLGAARAAGRPGTILEDLRGRGLTLNSVGLSLNPASHGLPLDPMNGAADIEAHLVRASHPHAFLEQPMLVVTAIRLCTRMGFTLEERTATRLHAALDEHTLAEATPAARGEELEAIAYGPDPAAVVRALEREPGLETAFGKGVRSARMNLNALARMPAAVESWEQLGYHIDPGPVALACILAALPVADQARLARSLPSPYLAAAWKHALADARTLEKKVLAIPNAASATARLHQLLTVTSPEAIVCAAIDPKQPKAARKLRDFQTAAAQVRQRLPFGLLRALGAAPHSAQSEQLLAPLFQRLLQGEPLSDADLAEAVRAAVAARAQAVTAAEAAPGPRRPSAPRAPAKPAPRPAKAARRAPAGGKTKAGSGK
ncbi:MAG: hypothetical protein ACRD1M_12175 [Terriglobales bacterium]